VQKFKLTRAQKVILTSLLPGPKVLKTCDALAVLIQRGLVQPQDRQHELTDEGREYANRLTA
jgi:hypothetical protein